MKGTVLAVLRIAHRRRRALAEGHQSVAVRVIEGLRRGRSQHRRNATQGDDLRVVHIDERTDTRAQ